MDDLVVLGNNLDSSLEEEIVKITFKGDLKKECIYTRNKDLTPEIDIEDKKLPNTVIAYNLIRQRWESINLSNIETAEAIIND